MASRYLLSSSCPFTSRTCSDRIYSWKNDTRYGFLGHGKKYVFYVRASFMHSNNVGMLPTEIILSSIIYIYPISGLEL